MVVAPDVAVIVGMAIVVLTSIADELRRSATDAAVHDVEAIVRGYVDPDLTESSLDLDAPREPAIEAELERLTLSGEIRRINMWSRDGRIVYSSLPEFRGQRLSTGPQLTDAYARDGSPEVSMSTAAPMLAARSPATACSPCPATTSSSSSRSGAPSTAIRSGSLTSTRTPASSSSGSMPPAPSCSWWPSSPRSLLALLIEPAESTVRATGPIRIAFRNGSSLPHNLVFRTGMIGATRTIVEAGGSDEVLLDSPAPGRYAFACTIHEGMDGVLIVLVGSGPPSG